MFGETCRNDLYALNWKFNKFTLFKFDKREITARHFHWQIHVHIAPLLRLQLSFA